MNLYPAIDLFHGKVVRLTQGDFNACTVYSNQPADTAKGFEKEGAQWIHVVDLEGAKTGKLANEASLSAICKGVKAQIEFGGGLRTIEDIQRVLDLGVSRAVIGTKALDKNFLTSMVQKFGERLAVGLDVRRDFVKTAGWMRDGNITLQEALALFNELGVKNLIYTDIEKDGALKGPNFEKLSMVLANTQARVILSGGVGQLTDIEKCRTIKESNFEGVIIGKALYDKRFTLTEAFRAIS
jgi:phosphoribosylformimino-5-aminoimidazole carboxamide ribotide isomerase